MNSEKVLVGLLLTLLAVVVSYRLLHPDSPHAEAPLGPQPAPLAARHQLIYVGAKWCAPCRQMRANTLGDPSVAAAIAREFDFVGLDLDADKPRCRQLGVTTVPTSIVMTLAGRELRRCVGYRPPAAFLEWLHAREDAPPLIPPGAQLASVRYLRAP